MSAASAPVLKLTDATVFDESRNRMLPIAGFSVQTAQVVAVVGPDTPLLRKYLRLMAAIDLPDQGKVEVFGSSSEVRGRSKYKQLRSRLGYVIGDSSLLPNYNGLMNVMLPALYHYRSRTFKAVSQDARGLIEELGCDFDIQMLPHAMSRFQQTLLQLARVLILGPEILYIEEPFHQMTTDDRRLFSEKLMSVRDRIHSKCIIIATDYLGFVRKHADRILFVDAGCVEVFDGWDVFASSRTPAIVRYLGRETSSHINSEPEKPET